VNMTAPAPRLANGKPDFSGMYVIPPGGYVAIQANAAAVGFASIMWAEYPINI